jgi:hypothetical protein
VVDGSCLGSMQNSKGERDASGKWLATAGTVDLVPAGYSGGDGRGGNPDGPSGLYLGGVFGQSCNLGVFVPSYTSSVAEWPISAP